MEWVRICPEADCGLPVPREPMRLAGDPGRPRLIANGTGSDLTERLERWADARLDALAGLGLSGYVCKSGSPSCGMEPAGLFTRMFVERFPGLPVEEEGRLQDPGRRGDFLRRLRA